jgi:predicted alpha/beta-hydrolase family hydrolase
VVIPVEEGNEVSGTVSVPASGATHTAVIIAHGAGNDMNHPLLRFVADGLTGAGYLSLRFNFLYKEKGNAGPDPQDQLYAVWRSACRFLDEHPRYQPQEIIAAGKSLGGRIASQMVAEGRLPVARLVFLGYPLHPPGKQENLRDAHLYEVRIPMLFFAGTRDQLCDLGLRLLSYREPTGCHKLWQRIARGGLRKGFPRSPEARRRLPLKYLARRCRC